MMRIFNHARKSGFSAVFSLSLFVGLNVDASAQTQKSVEAQQKAFVENLIGNWSLISPDFNKVATPKMLAIANTLCKRTPRLSGIRVQAAALSTTPENIRGSVIYYRTKNGLQRLDIDRKNIVLITGIRQRKLARGPVAYQLFSNTRSITTLITKLGNATGNVPVLIEDSALYLRCKRGK